MTQDPQIILKGLKCCSYIDCLCEECPFGQPEVHCRELESDAASLIKSLLNQVANQEEIIYKLEERLGIMNEQD